MTKPHWQGGSGGKGSAARNMEITQEQFANNWDRIFDKKGKTNEQRTGCDDGQLEQSSSTSGETYSRDSGAIDSQKPVPAHDRVQTSSGH